MKLESTKAKKITGDRKRWRRFITSTIVVKEVMFISIVI